jgi:phosphonate transport system substrate-binding protein
MVGDRRLPAQEIATRKRIGSRRQALALALGASRWLPEVSAAEMPAPIRLAVSESTVVEVHLNDARAAGKMYLQRLSQENDIRLDYNPKIFESSGEILDRARRGVLDAVALSILEYRQVAGLLDSSQIVVSTGTKGRIEYVILVKRNGVIKKVDDLRGRSLVMQKGYKMCVAPFWLSALFPEGQHGLAEEVLGSAGRETNLSRVVLPVFFGKVEACLTLKQGFDTICELNPQVAKELQVLAISPEIVVSLYAFSKKFRGAQREKFIKALSSVEATAAGQQLATLFQFDQLHVTDGACLAPTLEVIEKAERARNRAGNGMLGGTIHRAGTDTRTGLAGMPSDSTRSSRSGREERAGGTSTLS